MNPQADKLVRRITMVATVTASYFLLTADYGPEPNVLDPIKKSILSAQSSLKEFIVGSSREEHQGSSQSSNNNAKEHPTGSVYFVHIAFEEGISMADLEELQSDVKEMAEKILEYRATIPDQLKTTLDSILSTQRPDLPRIDDGSEPGPSAQNNADSIEMNSDAEQRAEEKIRSLKGKTSSNISAMPVVLKRMKVCISRIEKLESCNGIIHPALKKRKLVDPIKLYFHN
ncbi:hypothetical protein Gotri_012951 [Gossypium trilobum]|uniref:Uncharacterized protein n=1 Tax=Gossypium trilobum TaxID=34281 RepID=A0A7J9DSA8_9ROSI|nr:hypothetical protein [Gossypium trilobum]